MDKNKIKKFAIDARKKLIATVTDRAGMIGITEKEISSPVSKGTDFEVYLTNAGTEVTLDRRQCEQRRKLADQINARGFEPVMEEVAYTWFNRLCAIRFMEVNDYMYPARVRVLSSEKEGKNEPDIVTLAPDIDWDFTEKEREAIIEAKMNNRLDDLFKMLFIKQCNLLHEILPGLFEVTEDYTEMLLSISYTNEDDVVCMLIDGVDERDFDVNTIGKDGKPTGQVEIIGWLYQYYNTELKDDTFAKLKKNVKITKERIPAATQLFTPDWIVRYMVENSVGRIWIGHLRALDADVDEKQTAEKFGWNYYLPEAGQEEAVNLQLAEIRKDYRDLQPTDIKCIDPCMGSGHILIAMFDVLMDIYKSAGYSERDAAFEIVENNIHGLDIDKRAYQLAYFAVMMKGRRYNRRFFRGRDEEKPEPKVYAIMESNEIDKNHLQFFGKSLDESERNKAKKQMEYLLHTFVDAREYGSILNVEECDWELLENFVADLDVSGQYSFESIGSEETQGKLRALVQVAQALAQKYHAVVTNPPYMGSSGMSGKLSEFVKKNYPDSKSDLFAVFIERCGQLAEKNCYQAMITQHAWMFLSSFEKLREKLQKVDTINMAHLGARAFDEISGEVVQTTSFVMRKSYTPGYYGTYQRLIDGMSEAEKAAMFCDGTHCYTVRQDNFSKIPGAPVAYWVSEAILKTFQDGILLKNFAEPRAGLATGDNELFERIWFEVSYKNIGFNFSSTDDAAKSGYRWFPCNSGGQYRKWYFNNELVVNWENDGYKIKHLVNKRGKLAARPQNTQFYFKEGLTWNKLSSSRFAVKYKAKGFIYDDTSRSLFIDDDSKLPYLLGLLCSCVTFNYFKMLNPSMSFTNGDLERLPYLYDETCSSDVDLLVRENLLLSRADWDSFEISWDFQRHPLMPSVEEIEALKGGDER